MQLLDGHVATIKAVIIQIKLNRFLVKKSSKTSSSHLKLNGGDVGLLFFGMM